MDGIRAVIFDLDNTLIDRDLAMASWLRGIVPAGHLATLLTLDASGYGDRDTFFATVARDSGLAQEQARTRFQQEFPGHMRLKDGAEALLDRLASRYDLALATNGRSAMQRAKIAAVHLDTRFQVIAISQEVGSAKPQAEYFRWVLRGLGREPSEALMVGDHPANDIVGAAACGLRTCWLRTPAYPEPSHADLIIAQLSELQLPP
jgi:putative hydrolase of the HAD superfamily